MKSSVGTGTAPASQTVGRLDGVVSLTVDHLSGMTSDQSARLAKQGRTTMKYMLVWTIRPENSEASIKRFKEADPKVAGVKLLGRWHEMSTGHGFALLESDDPVAVAKFTRAWNDLIDQRIVPVIDDVQAAAALQ